MSRTVESNFVRLPVELVHRIFDYLDAETILFSMRCSCKWLLFSANSYPRYELNFRFMSKSRIQCMARLIQPKHVVSLTVSNEKETPGLIQIFLSHFRIEQFTALRTLNLIKVKGKYLRDLQQGITACPIESLFMSVCKYDDEELTDLIVSVMSHGQMRNFELKGKLRLFHTIRWPIESKLEIVKIHIDDWHAIFPILRHSPCLRTLVLKNVTGSELKIMDYADTNINQTNRLTSLTLYGYDSLDMDNIESLLCLLPMLDRFQLLNQKCSHNYQLFDGYRWENFIQTSLPLLSKFEFWFICDSDLLPYQTTVESLIHPFRTSFWLESKRWTVKCDYLRRRIDNEFHLYSIPVFRDDFNFPNQMNSIASSILNTNEHKSTIAVNAKELYLHLTEITHENQSIQNHTTMTYQFPNVTKLALLIDGNLSSESIHCLASIINPCNLQTLNLYFQCDQDFTSILNLEIDRFLIRACNLHSIIISYDIDEIERIAIPPFCLRLPRHIKRLYTDVMDFDDAKLILERGIHLSTITFQLIGSFQLGNEIMKWVSEIEPAVEYNTYGYLSLALLGVYPLHLWMDRSFKSKL